MKYLHFILLTVSLSFAACSADSNSIDDAQRGSIGKADVFGSCADDCGDKSSDGSCYCDELCAGYGDCCPDIVTECGLPQCNVEDGTGCAANEECTPGVCAECSFDTPDCPCTPATCEQVAPACEELDQFACAERDDCLVRLSQGCNGCPPEAFCETAEQGPTCGLTNCAVGEVCCNPLTSTCTQPDEFCTQ